METRCATEHVDMDAVGILQGVTKRIGIKGTILALDHLCLNAIPRGLRGDNINDYCDDEWNTIGQHLNDVNRFIDTLDIPQE